MNGYLAILQCGATPPTRFVRSCATDCDLPASVALHCRWGCGSCGARGSCLTATARTCWRSTPCLPSQPAKMQRLCTWPRSRRLRQRSQSTPLRMAARRAATSRLWCRATLRLSSILQELGGCDWLTVVDCQGFRRSTKRHACTSDCSGYDFLPDAVRTNVKGRIVTDAVDWGGMGSCQGLSLKDSHCYSA